MNHQLMKENINMTYIVQASGLRLQIRKNLEDAIKTAKEMLSSKHHSFKKGTRSAFIFSKNNETIILKDH